MSEPPPGTEPGIVRLVVILLGVITIVAVASCTWAYIDTNTVPGELSGLAGTGMGALGALLVSTRSR